MQQQQQIPSSPQKVKLRSKVLISYLYFIQGLFFGISSSLILTYQKVPSYDVLSMFTAASLPFSFKFISAPFIERYTSFKYGRRKTWVVVSLIIAGVIMLIQSRFSREEDQVSAALLFFAMILFISLEDISVDALGLKQLNSPQLASLLQSVMQLLGYFTGSMVFLELVSDDTYLDHILDVDPPIMTVETFICIAAFATIIPALLIHFFYSEPVLRSQQQQHQIGAQSLVKVVTKYKCFFLPKYRVCRQAIVFILYPHGIGYFNAGFPIELIKNYGFSKQLLTTLSNISIIPIVIITYVLSHFIDSSEHSLDNGYTKQESMKLKLKKLYGYQLRFLVARLVFCIALFLATPYLASNTIFCSFGILLLTILSNSQFLIDSTLVGSHASVAKYSAMYATMMASLSNLGRNTSIQLKIIGHVGYQYSVAFGLIYFVVWVLIFKKASNWIAQGLPQQKATLEQEPEKQQLAKQD